MKLVIILIFFLSQATPARADLYARDGGTSSACTSWSDACDQVTTAENIATRSTGTIWVADGVYTGVTFNLDASGTNVIAVKKATIANHGTETGWLDSYGDGQAEFTGDFVFTRPYYTIDGQVRNESNWKDHAAYGIQVPGIRASRLDGGHVGSDCSADNLTFRYLHIGVETTDFPTATGQSLYIGGFGAGSVACEDWTLHRSLVQNTYEVQCAGCEDLLIEYTYFYIGWAKEAIRGQVYGQRVTVRWSIFEDSCQKDPDDPTSGCTAEIAAWDGTNFDEWKVYGNVFYKTTSEANCCGVIIVGDAGWSGPVGPVTNNSLAYNNTIVGVESFATVGIRLDGGTGNVARNNLYYDMYGATTPSTIPDTSNNSEVGADPFVNLAGGNFRLVAATAAGAALSSPYDTDMDGNTRGADGTWDLGAFEFVSAGGESGIGRLRNRVPGRRR